MAVKTAANLRKRAAKAKKRNEREKAWRQKKATPQVLEPADYEAFWVLSGENLGHRPAPLFMPGPPPTSAKSGRWVSRRHLQVDDVLLLKRDENAKVTSLPTSLDDEPRLLHLTRMEEVVIHPPSTIRCTPKHPFYVRDKGWTAAGDLQPGDLLMTPDGDWVPVDGVEDRGEVVPVFNLHVAKAHTYYAAGTDAGPFVLVHNDSGNSKGPSQDQIAEALKKLSASAAVQALAVGQWARLPLTINGEKVFIRKEKDGGLSILVAAKGRAGAVAAFINKDGIITYGEISGGGAVAPVPGIRDLVEGAAKKAAEASKKARVNPKLENPEKSQAEVALSGIALLLEGTFGTLITTGKQVPDGSYDISLEFSIPNPAVRVGPYARELKRALKANLDKFEELERDKEIQILPP